jgi:hypothetical protein
MDENPEYFIAISVALMRRFKQTKITLTLQEMEEAAAYGLGLHTHKDMTAMDVELLTNPAAQPNEEPVGLDYTKTPTKPSKLN